MSRQSGGVKEASGGSLEEGGREGGQAEKRSDEAKPLKKVQPPGGKTAAITTVTDHRSPLLVLCLRL